MNFIDMSWLDDVGQGSFHLELLFLYLENGNIMPHLGVW